jgi:NADPH:quinone reductase-like Zn-dependent oxidoreductase
VRAAVQRRYGHPRDVIRIEDVSAPEAGPEDLLIQVAAASVNALDWHLVTGTPRFARLSFGLTKPGRTIPGADVAGTVTEVGAEVSGFSPGDEVFGEINGGGFAEYVAAAARRFVHKPSNVGMVEAATLGVAALTAVQGLRDWGELQPGQAVLVNGASGGVGTFAVQVAKALGAGTVTAVCSTRNVEMARDLGADQVIDYTTTDFTSVAGEHDLFFDNVGILPLRRSRRVLGEDGVYVMITGPKGGWIAPVPSVLWRLAQGSRGKTRVVAGKTAQPSADDLRIIGDWVETGTIRPVIEQVYQLDDTALALSRQGEFHAQAKSVIIP